MLPLGRDSLRLCSSRVWVQAPFPSLSLLYIALSNRHLSLLTTLACPALWGGVAIALVLRLVQVIEGAPLWAASVKEWT